MMQCFAGVAGVYGELLEHAATMSYWRRGYDELLEGAVMASQARRRLPRHDDSTTPAAPRPVPRRRLEAASTSGSLTTACSDLGWRQTSAA
jgi:hypothetical protein